MQVLVDQAALLLARGGWVMIPLLAMSAVSLALVLERGWFWVRLHSDARRRRLATLMGHLRGGRAEAAGALAGDDGSVYGRVVVRLVADGPSDAVAMEAVEDVRPTLDRFMVSLSTIVTAAPLLGILGTVMGIIQAFALFGGETTISDPAEVAGPIGAALLTTAAGLVVALLTLFPFMVFRAQEERALRRLELLVAAAQQGLGAVREPARPAAAAPATAPSAPASARPGRPPRPSEPAGAPSA